MSVSTIKILAISGSLRSQSSNTRLIERVAEIHPDLVTIDIFADLERLPHFNPDREPAEDVFVGDLTQRMRVADGFIVSTPEYAHGVPGTLKNALDWLVGTDAFIEKPFALFQACDRSTFAPRSLIEILTTMSGIHVDRADLTIDLRSNLAKSSGILRSTDSNIKIKSSLAILSQFIIDRRNSISTREPNL
jgi:chromate reductase, NAD(P)H dehydrogenase (quinone)